MFSGIVCEISYVVYIEETTKGLQIGLQCTPVSVGSSVAVNGVCLTVVKADDGTLYFDIMQETLKRTTLKTLVMHSRVNVEHAINLTDSLDGTITLGHIDTTAVISQIIDNEYIFEMSNINKDLLVKKGSVVIDGMCLTIVRIYDNMFSVCIIPHTMNYVTWKTGDTVNIEYDYFLKSKSNYIGDHEDIVFSDAHGMTMAIAEGAKGRKTTSPNPWVGAICVTNSRVVSRGHHVIAGGDHAEVACLHACLEDVDTMYVTLEPCCHWGKTPPCCNLIIERGIRRVVIGVLDPDPKVHGQGMKMLVRAGIEVKLMDSPEVHESLKEYLHHRSTGRPYVFFKLATSLNNKITNKRNNNRITCHEAIVDSHIYRSIVDGIGVGKHTWNTDKPQLTVRYPHITNRQPTKIVWGDVDGVITMNKKQSLSADLEELGSRGMISILVEGGRALFRSFVESRLINELVIYISNEVLDDDEMNVFEQLAIFDLRPVSTELVGTTVKIIYRLP